MTRRKRVELAMEDIVLLKKEFSCNTSLEVENDLKRAEWYLEYLYEMEDREDELT